MMQEITSVKNPLIKEIRYLKDHPSDCFLVEGGKMTEEAVACGAAQRIFVSLDAPEIISRCQGLAVPVTIVSSHILDSISNARTPQKIVCQCRKGFSYPEPKLPRLYAALNNVQDPGNAGTILRTLDAAGGGTLIMDRGCANPFSSKALAASMGSIFRVRIHIVDDLPGELMALREDGVVTIAGDLKGDAFFGHPPLGDRVCVVIGNEGHGISDSVRACVMKRYRLPIPGGAESLNAAVSAGIFLYDILRDILAGGEQ